MCNIIRLVRGWPIRCWLLSILGLGTPLAGEEIRGRVETREGTPIERTRVEDVQGGRHAFTDGRGHFALDCQRPCIVVVTHPRFVEQAVDVLPPAEEAAAGGGEDVAPEARHRFVITLESKQEIYEEIVVIASRGGDAFAPASIASTVVRSEHEAAAPLTLTELVAGVPGVAENGQGGHFQVFSIRGVSRQRVMTLVSGMRIVGERRAGVSTSFLDPLLIGSADVLRGPSSTYYGSGALGGVVQVFPRRFDGLRVATGYHGLGDESYLALGWGDGDWSLGVTGRRRHNSTAADGTQLNDHFSQYSATLSRSWRGDGRTYELLVLPAAGRDIGKSNTDFPRRTTNYPRENHLLARFGVTTDGGWSWGAFVHPNDLTTETLRLGESLNVVEGRAFDIGADAQRRFHLAGNLSATVGVDYFGRRGVQAREREEDLVDGAAVSDQTTLDGERDEAALYGSLGWGWGAARLQAGARFTWHQLRNCGAPRREDTAWTGFLGLVRPLGGGLELFGNVGTGFRFASLSERYFTGTTGRGQVLGNPDLEPESSLSSDLGLRWYGKKTFLSGQLFHLAIDDYIERVDVDASLRTFVNLTSGTIVGVELDGFYEASERWQISWSAHRIEGEDERGDQPLADVPTDRFQVGLRYRASRWEGRLRYQQRARKDDPGVGEKTIPAAGLVSAALAWKIRDGLEITLRGSNLLDQVYYSSADRKSPVAPGRSLGLDLVWGL